MGQINTVNDVPLYVIPMVRDAQLTDNPVLVPGVSVNGRTARIEARRATGLRPLTKDETGTGERFCEDGKRAAYVICVNVTGVRQISSDGLIFHDGTAVTRAEYIAQFRQQRADPMTRLR